jgi:hypothetical protein
MAEGEPFVESTWVLKTGPRLTRAELEALPPAWQRQKQAGQDRELRAASLEALAQIGDVEGFREIATVELHQSNDPVFHLVARILNGEVKTGINIHLSRRRGRQSGGERPVECYVLTGTGRERRKQSVPRTEIALAVLTRLPEPANRNELVNRTGIMAVVGEVATLYGIGEDAVRDCFEQHWRQLALQRVFGAPAQW